MVALARPEILGRYAIYGKIAAGGMASVHFGRLLGVAGFSRTVAIKRLHPHLVEDPEFSAAILDEARLAARIHHPNVVSTLDVVSAGKELLVVMEYVRGESLSRLLKEANASDRPIPPTIVSAIIVGALQGLHAAHEATNENGAPLGIVHRDVSPQNILVGVDGQSRVIDFGVAKAAGRLQTTSSGMIKGKVSYMSPEQLGSGEVTRQSDLYAMAVVLWEALTNRRLFQGDDQGMLFGRVLAGVREPPSHLVSDLPEGLDALVMRGLAKDPANRFASAREMADLLMRVLPPAFPPDVAAWVEEAAREGLAERGAIMAEIESASGLAELRAPLDREHLGREHLGRYQEDALKAEGPASAPAVEATAPYPRSHRAKLASILIVAVCLAAGGGVLWARGRYAAMGARPRSQPVATATVPGATPDAASSPSDSTSSPRYDPVASASSPHGVSPPSSISPVPTHPSLQAHPTRSPRPRPAHPVDPLAP